MTKKIIVLSVSLFLALGLSLAVTPDSEACGRNSVCGAWGAPGGGDFSPQGNRIPYRPFSNPQQVSQDQARQIVTKFLARYNRGLSVGQVSDQGPYFEVEVLTPEKKVFDRLAVDKSTGRVRPLG